MFSGFLGRGWVRLLVVGPVVVVLIAVTSAAGTAAPVQTQVQAPIQPVIPHDFPDPAVLAVGGTYYAYSTASRYGNRIFHVPVQHSARLSGGWNQARDAMPTLPDWVAQGVAGDASVWAPQVAARSDGSYLLYFTARSGAQHVQCIGAALSDSPAGPFYGVGAAPLVCRAGDHDSIDPAAFTDPDGAQYLLYSASSQANATIWLQPMSPDGTRTVGARSALIRADRADEAHIVEAPTLVRHGDTYVLFYSGNAYNSGSYFTNYATASSLSGTFVKHDGQLLNQQALHNAYHDPGGQNVVPGARHDYLIFHAFTSAATRAMFVVGLNWDEHNHPVLDLHDISRDELPSRE